MSETSENRWTDDHDYTELPLSSVRKESDGYALEREGDWGTLWIADPGFEPKVGELARFYGRGTGFPVRGVVIAGRVARYQTADELNAQMQSEHEAFERKCREGEHKAAEAGRTEQAMRETKAPWPKTPEELAAYVQSLVDGPHTYGTCCYAASLASTATFNYVCSVLGMTGFQASCADLDMVRRTRSIEGPFMLIKAEDALEAIATTERPN